MAHELTHEVYEHAPQDLTQAELTVLAVVAYHAQVTHRRCWMTSEDMQRRSRLSTSALKQTYQRLAHRGLECRVPQGAGKDGRPLYAFRGRSTVFELPAFPTPNRCGCTRRKGDATQSPFPPEGDMSQSPFTQEGDVSQSPSYWKGDSHTSPSTSKGDVSQSPFEEKGDVSQSERGLSHVPLNERTKELPGGTTEVTTGPRANPTPPTAPLRPSPHPRPRPIQSPLLASVHEPPAIAAATAVPAGSLCRRPDCRDPEPCGACGRARTAQEAELAAAATEQQLAVTHREHERRIEAHRRAEERAAAAATCPLGCLDGYLPGGWRCDHQVRPGPPAEWYAVRDQLPAPTPAAPRRGVLRGRHHQPGSETAAS